MSKVSNILVPIDFSEETIDATKLAIEWSSMLNCNITFLHTYRLISERQSDNEYSPSEIRASAIERQKREFETFKNKLPFNKIPAYKLKLEPGFASDAIIRFAKEDDTDLIILGYNANRIPDRNKKLKKIIMNSAVPVIMMSQPYSSKNDDHSLSDYKIVSFENSIFIGQMNHLLHEMIQKPQFAYLIYPSPNHEKQFTSKLSNIANQIVNFKKGA